MAGSFTSGDRNRGEPTGSGAMTSEERAAALESVSSGGETAEQREKRLSDERWERGYKPWLDPPSTPTIGESFDWQTKFRTDVVSSVEKWADDLGWSKFTMDAFVRDNLDGAIQFIFNNVSGLQDPRDRISTGRPEAPMGMATYEKIWQYGMLHFQRLTGMPFGETSGGSGSGRRSSGSSGPTADDIRNMFDVDQLTDAATNIWRAYNVEEPTKAKALAQSYIDTIVATRGEKEIDFETFILNQVKKSDRYKVLYQNKPDGVTEMAYIQPFVQSATAVMGGGKGMNDVVAGGAALGASADAFRGRLARTDAVKNTTSFTNDLENRMRAVKGVLRG